VSALELEEGVVEGVHHGNTRAPLRKRFPHAWTLLKLLVLGIVSSEILAPAVKGFELIEYRSLDEIWPEGAEGFVSIAADGSMELNPELGLQVG
jgi:hypothetical protein